MAYDVDVIETVDELFRRRRESDAAQLEGRRAQAYAKDARIKETDASLAAQYRELIGAAFGKKPLSRQEIRSVAVDFLALRGELLVQNGFPADYLELKYECRRCADEGFVNGRMCQCYRKALNKEAASRTKLARLMEEQSFRSFRLDLYPDEGTAGKNPRKVMERIFERCREYAENFGSDSGNLLFCGPTGVGKTFMSSAIAREVIESGHSVVYDSISNIIADYEAVKFGHENRNTDKYESCELLIIDDLGTEMMTQFTESVIYTLLNDRINLRRPMIVSTNLDGQSMEKFYSQSIISRLSGEFLNMPFTGTDLRQRRTRSKKQ